MPKLLKPFLVSLLFIVSNIIQAQTFEWVKTFGDTFHDFGNSIIIDASGNVYTTGFFRGTVDFDPGVGVSNLTSEGFSDVFVLKMDPDGNYLWARSFGGTGYDIGESITIGPLGNLYTTGSFQSTADFDPGAGVNNLSSEGSDDIFIQKLDADGNFLWAKSFGGSDGDYSFSIDIDASGNAYTVGTFQGTTDFDPGIEVSNLTSLGYDDVFIHKMDIDGNFLWAKSVGGINPDFGLYVKVDNEGNVHTTGYFWGTVDFDPGIGVNNLTSNGQYDIFIHKMDTDGNFLWAKSFGETEFDIGESIAIDPIGNIYLTGFFRGTVDFDPGPDINNLISEGFRDVFVQKLDNSGNFLWAKSFGGIDSDVGASITLDDAGYLYLTGRFRDIVDFNPSDEVFNLTSAGANDIFIQKLDGTGNFIWALSFGGIGEDEAASIVTDAVGNIYTTGRFPNTPDFDPGDGTSLSTSAGMDDIFIHKMSQCSNISTDKITACDSFVWIDGITYSESNNEASFVLINEAGCDSTVLLDLIINSVSDISTSNDGATITSNNLFSSYQWLNCLDFVEIDGETSQTFSPSENGSFAVELTENGCIDTSECVTITSVSIDELTENITIKTYPNPTTNDIDIILNRDLNNVRLILSDVQGRVIFEQNYAVLTFTTLDLPEANGVYILTVKTQSNSKSYKIIKK